MNLTGRNLPAVAQEAKENPYRITANFIPYEACCKKRVSIY
jgi:hypothetical protein